MPIKGTNKIEVTHDKNNNVTATVTYDNPANKNSSTHALEITRKASTEETLGSSGEGLADVDAFLNRRWPFNG